MRLETRLASHQDDDTFDDWIAHQDNWVYLPFLWDFLKPAGDEFFDDLAEEGHPGFEAYKKLRTQLQAAVASRLRPPKNPRPKVFSQVIADIASASGKKKVLLSTYLPFAELQDADLGGLSLEDGNISGANLNGASLRNVNLDNVTAIGTDFRGVKDLIIEQLHWNRVYIKQNLTLMQ